MGRRSIIAVVAVALAGIVALTVAALLIGGDDRRIGALTTSGTGKWVFELNGQDVGRLQSLEGCRPRLPVVETVQTDAQGNPEVDKQVGNKKYVPCVLRFGTEMDQPVYDWMKKMLDETPQRRNLRLSEVDDNNKVQTRIELQDGLISRIVFPRLDKASTAAASFELTVLPETLTRTEGQQGTLYSSPSGTKVSTTAGFRLMLNGVQDSDKATVIEPLVVDQKVVEQTGGAAFTYQPTTLSVGDLEVAMPRAFASGFAQWFSSALQAQAQSGPQSEKTGTIEFFESQTTTHVIMTLNLTGVGIFEALGRVSVALSGSAQTAAGANGYRLYVEGATLTFPAQPPPPPPPATTTAPPPAPPPPPTTAPPPPPPPAPTSPPPPPPNETLAAPELKATGAEEGRVALDWTAVEGAELYRIYKSGKPGGPYELVSQTKGETTASVTEESKTLVHFIVRAVAGEVESPDSNEVAVEVP